MPSESTLLSGFGDLWIRDLGMRGALKFRTPRAPNPKHEKLCTLLFAQEPPIKTRATNPHNCPHKEVYVYMYIYICIHIHIYIYIHIYI